MQSDLHFLSRHGCYLEDSILRIALPISHSPRSKIPLFYAGLTPTPLDTVFLSSGNLNTRDSPTCPVGQRNYGEGCALVKSFRGVEDRDLRCLYLAVYVVPYPRMLPRRKVAVPAQSYPLTPDGRSVLAGINAGINILCTLIREPLPSAPCRFGIFAHAGALAQRQVFDGSSSLMYRPSCLEIPFVVALVSWSFSHTSRCCPRSS